jgi:hypothetical protein
MAYCARNLSPKTFGFVLLAAELQNGIYSSNCLEPGTTVEIGCIPGVDRVTKAVREADGGLHARMGLASQYRQINSRNRGIMRPPLYNFLEPHLPGYRAVKDIHTIHIRFTHTHTNITIHTPRHQPHPPPHSHTPHRMRPKHGYPHYSSAGVCEAIHVYARGASNGQEDFLAQRLTEKHVLPCLQCVVECLKFTAHSNPQSCLITLATLNDFASKVCRLTTPVALQKPCSYNAFCIIFLYMSLLGLYCWNTSEIDCKSGQRDG